MERKQGGKVTKNYSKPLDWAYEQAHKESGKWGFNIFNRCEVIDTNARCYKTMAQAAHMANVMLQKTKDMQGAYMQRMSEYHIQILRRG